MLILPRPFINTRSQFHYKTDQGVKNFRREDADQMAMKDPDYAIRDLYNAISKGEFPSYTM